MISSLSNDKVKHVRRLQADRRYRAREAAFVVEGTRWLQELLLLTPRLQAVFYTASWREAEGSAALLDRLEIRPQPVTDEVMAAMSDTETPPGILAVVKIEPLPLPPAPTLVLVLDRVTNPGNLGTMLRTAGAAGVDAVLLAPGTVDAYNPKVVRGGMGAHLRLPVHHLSWPEIDDVLSDLAVWVAAAGGDSVYSEIDWRRPSALIIGSEAHGAGRAAHTLSTGAVSIPMHAATESLNAAIAAGVILFEAARQRRRA